MRDLSRDIESLRIQRGQPPRRRFAGKWSIVIAVIVAAEPRG